MGMLMHRDLVELENMKAKIPEKAEEPEKEVQPKPEKVKEPTKRTVKRSPVRKGTK